MALLAAPHRPVAAIGRLSLSITYASQENNDADNQITNAEKEKCKLNMNGLPNHRSEGAGPGTSGMHSIEVPRNYVSSTSVVYMMELRPG